jgi:cardiolipin synthase
VVQLTSAQIDDILLADRTDEQQRLGRFDPDRVPRLEIEAFPAITSLKAAVSPDCSYRLVSQALAEATSDLRVYIYNISAEHLIALLTEAKDRGIDMRIMYDTTDSRGDETAKLKAIGVPMKAAPSSGRRQVFTVCHQKFVVIDDRTVLLGSANWANTSIPKVTVPGKFKKGNREWLIRIDSDPMAAWFAGLFDTDWEIPEMDAPAGLAGVAVTEELGDVMVPARLVNPPDEVFDIAEFTLETGVRVTPLISPDNYFDAVLAIIEGAESSIDVEQQYIKEGGPKTKALLAALARKHRAGKKIRIIVSPAFRKVGATDSWEASVASLTKHGLEGCLKAINLEYFTHLHNKGLIVDRCKVVVSSTNWSENSIVMAREAGVLIDSSEVAEYFARVMDLDWSVSWDAVDVPANLVLAFEDVQFVPNGFEAVHPADLA